MPFVSIQEVVKEYSGRRILDHLSLEIKEGEVFALLGHNGAGKSTLIKIITGLITPDEGAVLIGGRKMVPFEKEMKKMFSYLPETMSLYPHLTAIETLQFFAKLQNIPLEKCEEVLEDVGLYEFRNKKVGCYSKGMTQRMGFAVALLSDVPFYIFDEPTSGLDPYWAIKFKDVIAKLRAKGAAVLFASHILSEVEALADKVGILSDGRLMACGTIDQLRSLNHQHVNIMVRFAQTVPTQWLAKELGTGVIVHQKGEWMVITADKKDKIKVLRLLEQNGRSITDIEITETTLEDIYREMLQLQAEGQ